MLLLPGTLLVCFRYSSTISVGSIVTSIGILEGTLLADHVRLMFGCRSGCYGMPSSLCCSAWLCGRTLGGTCTEATRQLPSHAKQNQVILFLYMVCLMVLFIIQFSVSVAALSVTSAQQESMLSQAWCQLGTGRLESLQQVQLKLACSPLIHAYRMPCAVDFILHRPQTLLSV